MIQKNLWISFFPIWVLVNVMGWFVNIVISFTPYFGWKIPLSAAFILSVLQWIVLNNFLRVDLRWIFASMLVYGSLNYAYYLMPDLGWFFFVELLILGLVGYLQYAVLKEFIYRAENWVFSSLIAGFLGFVFSYFLAKSLTQTWVIHGMVYGIITGAMLVLLMTAPKKSFENVVNDS